MNTKEEILKAVENFYYIDVEQMLLIPERMLETENEQDEEKKNLLIAGCIYELQILNKIVNVHVWKNQKEGFYKDRYEQIITGKHVGFPPDKDGYIENYGILISPEEFELYKEVYDEIYQIN
jgi:hypothetical protein